MGVAKVAVTLAGRSDPHVRDIEDELPDATLPRAKPLVALDT
jgi:hypothetical protein